MKDIVVNLIKNACAIEEEVNLESELGFLSIDSLTFVGLLVEIEDIFDVEFDIEELNIKKWNSVNDLYLSLEEKVNAKERS